MTSDKQPFERYPALASWIERMANTGSTLSLGEWMVFLGALNNALLTAERSLALPLEGVGGEGLASVAGSDAHIGVRPEGLSSAGKFDLGELAEVATKAVYTHGFGFRGVGGPYERDGKVYVNFGWDDHTLVRAVFWIDPEEAPPAETDLSGPHGTEGSKP